MILAVHPEEQMRMLAWYGLGVVSAYFILASLALRWQRRGGVRVAQYDPPPRISPALAAYLWERGVGDKPFVVALLNMASKGWLKIEQGPADYLFSRGDASVKLEDEEQVIAEDLFRGATSTHEVGGVIYSTIDAGGADSVLLTQLFKLGRMASGVRNVLESSVEPELLSSHFAWFVPGLTVSLWCFLAVLYADLDGLRKSSPGPVIMAVVFVVWALLATTKALPATVYKLKSHLPGRTPRPLPLVKRDLMVLIMLLVSFVSLTVLAWVSSQQFALQFGAFLVANLLGLIALRSPTTAGHAVLARLSDFRMFLSEVDSDRVNRINAPTAPSPVAEKYWAWALALDVEHAWGEQFAAAVLNLLAAASIEGRGPVQGPEHGRAAAEIIDLHLR
jgi:hypothetical protein